MLYFPKFFSGLILFSPAAYAIATPDQAQVGTVRGFTGPKDAEVTGDYLTATFCYCRPVPRVEEVMGLSHYYQFDYYNFHHNTTFILTSACPEDELGVKRECVPEKDAWYGLAGATMAKKCRTWNRYQNVHDRTKEEQDILCYEPDSHHRDDQILFNGQRRNLGENGGQGMMVRYEMEPKNACEDLCRDVLDASELQEHFVHPPSHQVVWTDVDDMCDHCE